MFNAEYSSIMPANRRQFCSSLDRRYSARKKRLDVFAVTTVEDMRLARLMKSWLPPVDLDPGWTIDL